MESNSRELEAQRRRARPVRMAGRGRGFRGGYRGTVSGGAERSCTGRQNVSWGQVDGAEDDEDMQPFGAVCSGGAVSVDSMKGDSLFEPKQVTVGGVEEKA